STSWRYHRYRTVSYRPIFCFLCPKFLFAHKKRDVGAGKDRGRIAFLRDDLQDPKAAFLEASLHARNRIAALNGLDDPTSCLRVQPTEERKGAKARIDILGKLQREALCGTEVHVQKHHVVAAISKHTMDLPKSGSVIDEVFHDSDTHDDVEGIIGKRKPF